MYSTVHIFITLVDQSERPLLFIALSSGGMQDDDNL